jgi:hypothetical protein
MNEELESVLLEKYIIMALGSLRTRNTSGSPKVLRCNMCGDSKSQPGATSAAILNSSGRWVYKCQRKGCEFNQAKLAARWLRKTSEHLYQMFDQECKASGCGDERSRRIMENVEAQKKEQARLNAEKAKKNAELDKIESKSFRLLEEADTDLIAYLESRKIDWKSFPFHTADSEDSRFWKCVIFPVMENGRAVYWQGRKTESSDGPKYINRRNGKGGYILKPEDFDEEKPVMVCEGPFSALSVENGICTFGVQFTQEQYETIKGYGKAVFCYDNDRKKDMAGLKKMSDLLAKGHWVLIWSKFLKKLRLDPNTKDMNDVAVKLARKVKFEDLEDCVDNNYRRTMSAMW